MRLIVQYNSVYMGTIAISIYTILVITYLTNYFLQHAIFLLSVDPE